MADQETELELRKDQLWYKIDAEKPFTGAAVEKHPNGKMKSRTLMKDGISFGLIEEWDANGSSSRAKIQRGIMKISTFPLLALFPIVLSKSRSSGPSRSYAAELQAIEKQYKEAEKANSVRIADQPKAIDAYSRRGDARLFLGDFKGSAEDYEQDDRAESCSRRIPLEAWHRLLLPKPIRQGGPSV